MVTPDRPVSDEWPVNVPFPSPPPDRWQRLCALLTRHRWNRPGVNGYDYFTGRGCRLCGYFWHGPW